MNIVGYFKVDVEDDLGRISHTFASTNMVVNSIWERLGNTLPFDTKMNIAIGVGDRLPTKEDVSLMNQIHEVVGVTALSSIINDGNTLILKYDTSIPAGTLSTQNVVVKEIGLKWRYSAYTSTGTVYDPERNVLITRALIDPDNNGITITDTDILKITYELAFTFPSGQITQPSELSIGDMAHEVTYVAKKLTDIGISYAYLLGSQKQGSSYSSSDGQVAGWGPTSVKSVRVDNEQKAVFVDWEQEFDEFTAETIDSLYLGKYQPHAVSGGNYNGSIIHVIDINFNPPIEKELNQRLTLSGTLRIDYNW